MPKHFGGEISQAKKDSASKIFKIIFLIIIIIVVIWLIYLTYREYKNRKKNQPMLISSPTDATQAQHIKASKAPVSLNGNEYAYSFWIFVNDWTYKFGQAKCIFYRGDADCNKANPSIWLYPRENKLMVRTGTMSGDTQETSMNPSMNPSLIAPNSHASVRPCDIENIPLQRWVHVCVSLWNRTLDIYINGKLTRSCILEGVPTMDTKADLYVTQYGGFNGYISRLQYFNQALGPEKIYNMYKSGPSKGSWWWNSSSIPRIKFNSSSDS